MSWKSIALLLAPRATPAARVRPMPCALVPALDPVEWARGSLQDRTSDLNLPTVGYRGSIAHHGRRSPRRASRRQTQDAGPERRAQLLAVARRVFGRPGSTASPWTTSPRKPASPNRSCTTISTPRRSCTSPSSTPTPLAEERVRSGPPGPHREPRAHPASFQAYFDFVDEHAGGFRLLMQETMGGEEMFRSKVQEVRDRDRSGGGRPDRPGVSRQDRTARCGHSVPCAGGYGGNRGTTRSRRSEIRTTSFGGDPRPARLARYHQPHGLT